MKKKGLLLGLCLFLTACQAPKTDPDPYPLLPAGEGIDAGYIEETLPGIAGGRVIVYSDDHYDQTGLSCEMGVLFDATENKLIAARGAFQKNQVRSLPRLLMALWCMDNCDLHQELLITSTMKNMEVDYSYRALNLAEGVKISIQDLLYAMITGGAVDAANPIVAEKAGSTEQMARILNTYLQSLSLTQTTILSPEGGQMEGQVSTVTDLIHLFETMEKRPELLSLLSTKAWPISIKSDYGEDSSQLLKTSHGLLNSEGEGLKEQGQGVKVLGGFCDSTDQVQPVREMLTILEENGHRYYVFVTGCASYGACEEETVILFGKR